MWLNMHTMPDRYFSHPFVDEDVDWAKCRVHKHSLNGAKGIDGISYDRILNFPTHDLVSLFNICVEKCDVPQSWLMTFLAVFLNTMRLYCISCCLKVPKRREVRVSAFRRYVAFSVWGGKYTSRLSASQAAATLSCACTLQADINDSEKTILLKNLITATGPIKLSDVLSYQHYLDVAMPGHCKVLTQLMTLCHTLAMNCLQWDSLWRRAIPQELRLCRFCHTEVEDECHVMLYYITTTALTEKRGVFFSDAQQVLLGVQTAVLALPSPDLLRFLLGEKRCTISVADKMVKVSRAPPGLCHEPFQCGQGWGATVVCQKLVVPHWDCSRIHLLYSTHDSNYATFTQCNTSGSDEYEGPHMCKHRD
ncbi:uncharacterized protein LACBIDRAFT_332928 [Laccaria bicolor S238N-H82]|uniref:Predicted protein n=1 Tax=Laccaria bicolor (strain S238N-H82 / ATCC MYA-4686) TaxID=486041 RepID=B0DUA6_LACBS|nr:uncharacterized protein LACBIDRAFT_332928 [Laccaria bicolor S238N-H82]EDR01914.1 predicted protein [Laccaria bicolor S238N-H82]|eukprot:XP_001887524.1 predicted protein [Laccaria bicolor S238N-H82]